MSTPKLRLVDRSGKFHRAAPAGGHRSGCGDRDDLLPVWIENAGANFRLRVGCRCVAQEYADSEAGRLLRDILGRQVNAGSGEIGRVNVHRRSRDQPDVAVKTAPNFIESGLAPGQAVCGVRWTVIHQHRQLIVRADMERLGGIEHETGIGAAMLAEVLAIDVNIGEGRRPSKIR